MTTELLPFAIAAPTDDQRIFLASQIADEARHCVFFDRFFREVIGSDTQTIAENLAAQRENINEDFKQLFDGILHDCAETLRKDPSDMEALVRGITVYMIVIEGTLALTGARFILRCLKETDRLPGFRDGFTHVNRDESRHVGFGVKFLADAIKEDERYKQVVQETLQETLPVAVLAFAPDWVEDRYDFDTPFYHSTEMFEYAMRSLSKKLAAMGMEPIAAGARLERAAEAPARAGRAARAGRPRADPRGRLRGAERDGYAGMTTAKVAAASGQNKALIAYYFGSKQGLVAAVARRVSEVITEEMLGGVGEPSSAASSSAGSPTASGGRWTATRGSSASTSTSPRSRWSSPRSARSWPR